MAKDKIAVRSDLINRNTDFSKSPEEGIVIYRADPTKISNIIKAYGCLDPDVGYCPGYN
jgi:hypothetical protein